MFFCIRPKRSGLIGWYFAFVVIGQEGDDSDCQKGWGMDGLSVLGIGAGGGDVAGVVGDDEGCYGEGDYHSDDAEECAPDG